MGDLRKILMISIETEILLTELLSLPNTKLELIEKNSIVFPEIRRGEKYFCQLIRVPGLQYCDYTLLIASSKVDMEGLCRELNNLGKGV